MNEGSGQVVRDWSGHGNNGYLGSTTGVDANDPSWIPGVFFGSALRFFGDDYVTIPATQSLQPQNLTVDAWVRFDSSALGGDSPGLFKFPLSMRDGCDNSSYGMFTDVNGALVFYITNSQGQPITSPAAASSKVWDGSWHNVGGTFDGKTVRFYLDGVQVGNGTPVPAGTAINYTVGGSTGAIGGYSADCGNSLDLRGDVDGVQIWSTALPIDSIWRTLKALLTASR